MNYITIIGLLAGVCTTVAFIPQVQKIYCTHRTSDLSLPTYVLLSIGILFWIIYGVLLGRWTIIIPNASVLIMCGYVIIMKIKHG